jgi:hypothetical protein
VVKTLKANNILGFDQLRLWYNYLPKANNILGFDQLILWYNYLPKTNNIKVFDQLSKPLMLYAFGI